MTSVEQEQKELGRDFEQLGEMKPPMGRAAYSDRTAWLMAILSEIAYRRFEEENTNYLKELAKQLVELSNEEQILTTLQDLAGRLRDGLMTNNEGLRAILAAGSFELKGVLFDAERDTQGFVAVRRQQGERGMAVVVFRGTQEVKDWITNLDFIKRDELKNGNDVVIAKVHSGFNQAFLSVQRQMNDLLKDDTELPVYFTGHSLGGALATLATWYTTADRLAACYTFGAPRIGDHGLTNRFRTPIYRLVNGADPVPFVPPSGFTIDLLKAVVRFAAGFFRPLEKLVGMLVRMQGYRHYGSQHYLTICPQKSDGDFPKLRKENGVSSFERVARQVMRTLNGEFTRGVRIDNYHDISLYRAKLRAFAKKRQRYLSVK